MYITIGILLIIIGILNICRPDIGWKIRYFFIVDGGEPTKVFLTCARVAGVAAVCAGVFLLLQS